MITDRNVVLRNGLLHGVEGPFPFGGPCLFLAKRKWYNHYKVLKPSPHVALSADCKKAIIQTPGWYFVDLSYWDELSLFESVWLNGNVFSVVGPYC